jgi:hypothetical protein
VVRLATARCFVVREAGRIAKELPAALCDPDDAFEWVVEHVPDDVRRILDFQLEFFQRKGVAVNGSRPKHSWPVVEGGAEQVAYILDRSAARGEEYLAEQVYAVVETQLSYLRAIGAIWPPAGDAADR